MTLKLGGQDVQAMYVGDKPVKRAYLGTELVWSAEPPPVFDPLALGWSAAGWAEDPNWSISDGAMVDPWPGHGIDLVSGPGVRPTWNADGIGGRPAVRFDGSNDWMWSTHAAISQPTSIVIIARYRSIRSGVSAYLCDGNGGAGAVRQIIATRPTGKWGMFAGTWLDSPGDADTDPHLLAAVYASSASKLAVDGATAATGNAGAYGLASFQLAGNGAPIDIAFWGIYAGDITADPDWPAWQAWALDHYGLTL